MTGFWNPKTKIAAPVAFSAALVGGYLLYRQRRKNGLNKIAGKTFVIVGASSGIGRGVAEELGKLKANVVIAARRNELLEEVAQNVKENGGNALVIPMDITKPEDVQQVKDVAVQEFGRIDVWINMAGLGAMGRFWEIPQEDQARLVEVNLTGLIYGSHTALQQFQDQGYGILINLGSVDSEVAHAYHATYSATKAGVKHLSLSLNQELRLAGYHDIKVVTIEPWAADTPFWTQGANYTGVKQKFFLMDDPQKVVNAIIQNSIWPQKVVPVGWKASLSHFVSHVLPRFNEWLTGNIAHKYQMEMPPTADDSKGALYEPRPQEKEVEKGIDERIDEPGV